MDMMKIMVAHASGSDRERIVEVLLELTNVAIDATCDLRSALASLDAGTPDVIVTDVRFPDGDGVDLIDAARRHVTAPAVVVIGDGASIEVRQRCVAAGAQEFVDSVDLDGLQRRVRTVALGRKAGWRGRGLDAGDRFAMVGRIAGGVAHDIANYLTVAEVSMAMVERRTADAGLRMEIVRARGALHGAAQLARTVLGYVRGGAPHPEPIDLADVTRRVLDLMARVIPAEVRLDAVLEPGMPRVRGVRAELEQLVLNLVLNACEAMPDGGVLHVRARATSANVIQLEVIDTGAGLGDEPTNPEAGPLSRSAKAGRDGGAGLGLGIVRAVVERHGGILRMGPAADRGTRVAVTLFGMPVPS